MNNDTVRTSFRHRRRHLASLVLGLSVLFAVAGPACSPSSNVAGGLAAAESCHLNSDCAAGLVCALGACRAMCASAADCGSGGTCIDNGDVAVCQYASEANTPCNQQSDCPAPLACASDYRCRNLCNTGADCNVLGITGRVCAKDAQGVYYCADPTEVTNGTLSVAPPPGAMTSTPVLEPDAGVGVVPPPDAAVSIDTLIGPAGGVLGIGPVKIIIPSGALASDVLISISPVASPLSGATGPVFDIEPTGTQFSVPATVTFSYGSIALGGLPPGDFAVSTVVGSAWQAIAGQVVDTEALAISGTTTHLSPYALVATGSSVNVPDSGTPSGSDATVEGGGNPAPDATVGNDEDGGGGDGGLACSTDAGLLTDYAPPLDGGAAVWACEKAICQSEVSSCSADSCCNATMLAALICEQSATSIATIEVCFSGAEGSADVAVMDTLSCISGTQNACQSAATADAAPISDTGAADAGTDACVSDASACNSCATFATDPYNTCTIFTSGCIPFTGTLPSPFPTL